MTSIATLIICTLAAVISMYVTFYVLYGSKWSVIPDMRMAESRLLRCGPQGETCEGTRDDAIRECESQSGCDGFVYSKKYGAYSLLANAKKGKKVIFPDADLYLRG